MQNTIQTSNRLFEITEEGLVFKPRAGYGKHGRLELDCLSSDMDGVFPRQTEWTKFSNKVDSNGGVYLLSYYLGGTKKLKGNIGYCFMERQNWYDDVCTLTFKEPIKMVVGGYRNTEGEWEHIIEEVDYLVGEVSYEWFWNRCSNGDRASSIEIYLDIKDYGKRNENVGASSESKASTVWLLEQYDQWFNKTSRIPFGVFTSKEEALASLGYGTDEWEKNEFYQNGSDGNQWLSDILDCGYIVTKVEVNKFEEL